jgi:hypothetical protein
MANIIQFPKAAAPPVEVPDEPLKEALPRRSAARGVLAFAWACVRIPLFLVLYWLRFPVMLVCRFFAAPVLLIFLFACYAFPEKKAMLTGLGVASFLGFAGLWLYDLVLMWLSPQDMVKTL